MYPYKWPKGASKVGYISTEEVSNRLLIKEEMSFKAGEFSIDYSVAMQRGYYRESMCFIGSSLKGMYHSLSQVVFLAPIDQPLIYRSHAKTLFSKETSMESSGSAW